MATKPTRLQDQACDRLAQTLLLITEAARLDGKSSLDQSSLVGLAREIARVSSAFGLDEILARSLEERGRALGLRSGTAELLTLVDGDSEPVSALLLTDDQFRERVAQAEAELGEI